jgi:methyl-accepting chemotaxis protein
MNLTASEIARNCSTVAAKVALANGGLVDSQSNMTESILSMQQIGEHVHETSTLITRLGEKSIQIGAITATIDDIADQTNLLALNAAIEAARAGENGRGFAVVADEVRALASRTTAATKEISDMIKAIQAETRQAISAMDQSVREVKEGTLMVARTGEALLTIANSVQSISAEVSQIATAAEQQSASVHGITTNIQQVTTIIRENADGTQEFATAASGLNIMAGDLQEIVGKFKLVPSFEQGSFPNESDDTPYVLPGLFSIPPSTNLL